MKGCIVLVAYNEQEQRLQDDYKRTKAKLIEIHETLWLSQAAIAALYQVTPQAITQHIKAIYKEGELEQKATCKAYLQVQQERAGKISKKAADEKACSEYIEYEKKLRLLKEAEPRGEKDIVGLLKWDKQAKR